jgi:transmembrane sensor
MNENSIPDSLYEAMVAYFENRITQTQAEELISWIGRNPGNLDCFHETEKTWHASGMLRQEKKDTGGAWQELVERINDNGKRPVPGRMVRIRISTLYKAAAAVLLLIAIGAGTIFFSNSRQIFGVQTFEAAAPRGSRSVITLSDGSIVWLNSGTTLKYTSDFGKSSRDVILDGEAFFNITQNREIPFKVNTSEICITALGTSFNVKAYSDENTIETTLETGEVRIDRISPGSRTAAVKPVFLKPNQKAVFIKGSDNPDISSRKPAEAAEKISNEIKIKPPLVQIDSLVDTRLFTSWKDSRWFFKSEKLSDLAPILERRYDVQITFMDSVTVNFKFTGTLKEESLVQVLHALTIAAPIRYEVSQNKVFLYEDKELKTRYMRQQNQHNK